MSELEDKQENNNKNNLTRFSITMPQDLLDEFDALIEREERPNRSDALRGLVRSYITQSRWQNDNNINSTVCGTVTLIYDHHVPDLMRSLTAVQHDCGNIILCSSHVHISHETCLECIIMRGAASKIKNFIAELKKIRRIKNIEAAVTSDI